MAAVILSIGCIFSAGTILMIDDNTYANGNVKNKSIVINSHPADNSELFQEIHLGQVLDGGVLPIRRFVMMGGRKLAILEKQDANRCNGKCLADLECHAWELSSNNQTCHLFADDIDKPLDIYQADGNDIQHVVGFMQRNAQVLRPLSASNNTAGTTASPRSERLLYIMYHDENKRQIHGYRPSIPNSCNQATAFLNIIISHRRMLYAPR